MLLTQAVPQITSSAHPKLSSTTASTSSSSTLRLMPPCLAAAEGPAAARLARVASRASVSRSSLSQSTGGGVMVLNGRAVGAEVTS